MITYAQNFEDVLLARVFRHKPYGFYIDVGAHDPNDLSVTRYFYDRGWHGINIEPIPANHQRFIDQRPRDINLNLALGEKSGTQTLHIIEGRSADGAEGSAFSSFVPAIARAAAKATGGHPVDKVEVPVRTLAEVCASSCREPVDFLKIDVEGWEKQVLMGADFSQTRPVVVVIEAKKPDALFAGFNKIDIIAGWSEWEPILTKAKYRFAHFDGINRFYIREEDADELLPFFALPVGIYDGLEITNKFWVAKSLKQSLVEEDERFIHTEQELARARAELTEAQATCDSLRVNLKELQQQVASSKEAADSLAQQLGQENGRTKMLTEQVEQLEKTGQAGEEKLKAELDANKSLVSQISDQNAKIGQLQGSVEETTARLQHALEQGNLLTDTIEQSRKEAAQLQASLEERIAKVANLAAKLETAAASEAGLQKEKHSLEQKLAEADENRMRLDRDLADLRHDKAKLEQALLDLQALAAAEQRRLRNSETELQKTREDAAQLHTDLKSRIATIARLTATAETFAATREKLHAENQTLQQQVRSVGARQLLLERKLAEVHNEKGALELASGDLQAQIEVGQRSLRDREKELEAAREESRCLDSDNRELRDRVSALNQRLSLIRTMAVENAWKRRHRVRLALLRWFPPLARLRHVYPESELEIGSIEDLLRPARLTKAKTNKKSSSDSPPQSVAAKNVVQEKPDEEKAPAQTGTRRKVSSKLKISVITPSFNTGDAIEQAILSVKEQDYTNFEHLIIDGGSTDNTLEILKRYPHLKWISEPDKGQSDAMNKGFQRATGDIVVYLNADDYFLPGAFSAVIPAFETGAQMVMGRVRVIQENDNTDWINDPRADFNSILRHWEKDAFCVNPVGYFYRKEVQQTIPFNLANDDKMDLEFLLDVAAKYEIVKINETLGVFNYAVKCKTGINQQSASYWQPSSFPFINAFVRQLPQDERQRYEAARAIGYQQRRAWTINQLVNNKSTQELATHRDLIHLPPLAEQPERWLTDGDIVIFTVSDDNIDNDLWQELRQPFPPEIPIYHLATNEITAASQLIAKYASRLRVRIVMATATPNRCFAAMFNRPLPKNANLTGKTMHTFKFNNVSITTVELGKTKQLLSRLATQWNGAASAGASV